VALAKASAMSLVGLEGTVVEVEADISSNLPNFVLVGLPDASLRECAPPLQTLGCLYLGDG